MSKTNRELLRLLNLPVIETIHDLAGLLHLDPARLTGIALKINYCYKRYRIPKRDGSERLIEQPTKELKAIQAWILRNILDQLSASNNATAYKRGTTLLNNVVPHESNRYFFCVDIEDFFPSVTIGKIFRVFKVVGYSPRISLLLASLCSSGKGLPQGGVTSPALSNLTSSLMDKRLSGLCARHNVNYTRYADDMTFSSNNPKILVRVSGTIVKIIQSQGYYINQKKLKFLGPHNSCKITGLVKNSSTPKFGIGNHKKKRMRAVMHSIVRNKFTDPQYKNESAIDGWLAYLKCVDATSYCYMNSYWLRLKAKYQSA